MSLSEGSCFYTKTAQNLVPPNPRAKVSWHRVTAKGYFIGLLLGHLKKGADNLKPNEFWQLIGNAGLVGFDDVHDCLGEESMNKLMKFVQKKYEKL